MSSELHPTGGISVVCSLHEQMPSLGREFGVCAFFLPCSVGSIPGPAASGDCG